MFAHHSSETNWASIGEKTNQATKNVNIIGSSNTKTITRMLTKQRWMNFEKWYIRAKHKNESAFVTHTQTIGIYATTQLNGSALDVDPAKCVSRASWWSVLCNIQTFFYGNGNRRKLLTRRSVRWAANALICRSLSHFRVFGFKKHNVPLLVASDKFYAIEIESFIILECLILHRFSS